MKYRFYFLYVLLAVLILSCSDDENDPSPNPYPTPDNLYFPSQTGSEWETVSLVDLEWNTTAEQALYDLLEDKNTKGFLILKDGRIAVEKYFGSFTKDSLWYWASAGKTLTSFSVGIAQEQGFLDIEDKSSIYLGEGWTSTTLEQENKITVGNQLSMTHGLKTNLFTFGCITPNCLEYQADAGTRWAYHNGSYTLLQAVVSNATNTAWSSYFNANLRDKIGMDGTWVSSGTFNIYFSTARSMARFGLLNLGNGTWNQTVILSDKIFQNTMKNTSQDLNKSYGYLWWLNGKQSHMGTANQMVHDGPLIPNAPIDTYAGLGKDDQKLYIVPSKGLVVVRMGVDAGENQLGPSSFDNALWAKINDLIN